MADLEHLDQKDLRVRKEIQVRLGPLDHLEMMVNMVLEDLQDLKEKRVSLASKEDLDQEVPQVWRDQRATRGLLASLVTQENRDRVVSRESLAILVTMAERETEGSKETLDLLASQGFRDLPANLECRVSLVNKAMLDLLEQRETLGLWDLLDYRGHRATKVLLDLKDLPA